MGRICKECKAGSAGVSGFFGIRPKAASFFGCRLEAGATIESGPRLLVFLDAGWKPALPLNPAQGC